MMNLKKLKILYISSLFIIVITCISGAYYFLKDRTDENYIAYVEVKTSKSIDHIFLAGSVDALMTEYMTRSLNQLIPAYDWEFNTANNIMAKFYTSDKRGFYRVELPKLEEKILESIPIINENIKKNFKSFFFDESTQQYLQDSKTQKLTYFKLSEQPFFDKHIRVKVKFRKEQLTMFEFISITIFLSLSVLSLTTALYIVNRNKLK